MTASHTAVITRNLHNSQADKTEKIDIASFLAGLNSNNGKAETSKEFRFFSDPTSHSCPSAEQKEDATTVKKIDFNEFLMSLKSKDKAPNPIEGPEKENVFCVPSQVSEDVSQLSAELVYSHEPPDSCNVTKVFGGQDDGMEMTKCQAPEVQDVFLGVSEAVPQQLPCADVTKAFADDGMDMTISHTAKMSFPFSSVGYQSLTSKQGFPSTELDDSLLKGASNQHSLVQHNSHLCTDKKTVNTEDRRDAAVLRAVKQEARTMAAIPGSVSSETVFRSDKTGVFAKCDDMEITGNYTDIVCDSTKEVSSLCHGTLEKPVHSSSSLAETRCPARGDGDMTSSLTSSGHPPSVSHRTGALGLSAGSGERMDEATWDQGAASVGAAFDSCTNSVSGHVSKSRLHRLANPQLVPLPGEKTVMFFGEDMDLTRSCVVSGDGKSAENDSPAGAFTPVTCKPHFLDQRPTSPTLIVQQEMEITKCYAVVIDDQCNGVPAEAEQMHCQVLPRKSQNKNVSEGAKFSDLDKENLEVISVDGSVKRSWAIETNSRDLEVVMVEKQLGKTNFQASALSSCVSSGCSLQEQKREVPENVVTGAAAVVSSQSQRVAITQPLQKNLLKASVSCTSDQVAVLSKEQNLAIVRTHPAAVGAAAVSTVQEHESTHNQKSVLAKQLQNQTPQCPARDVTSQAAAVARGDLEMNANKQTVTPLAPSGSFISSNEPAPSGVKGSELLGPVLGINADCQDSARQEKICCAKAVNKVLPTRADSKRAFSIAEAASSGGESQNPHSVGGTCSWGAEEPPQANLAASQKGSSQLPSFLEKSVVFPSGENMDLTGNCAVRVPDCTRAVLSERKAIPGYLVQDENTSMPLTGGVTMTINSQEQPVCDVYSWASGKKTVTTHGLKPLPFADEKTTLFTEDADMDITRSHTVSAENKAILQHRGSNDDVVSIISGDKTCVFTHSDDMEISRLDSIPIDKPLGEAATRGMLNMAGRAGRKSLKGTGEKTVLFSLSNENHDMEITESHTTAIGQEIVSQKEGRLCPASSANSVKTVLLTSSQADAGTTKSCFADKITVKVVCDGEQNWDEEVGQKVLPNNEATVCALGDMEITETHHVALEENALWGQAASHSVPVTATVLFTSYQADMEMTQLHAADESIEQVFCEDRSKLAKEVGQEAVPKSKSIVLPSAEDMEITRTHAAVLHSGIGVQDRGGIPALPAVPADKTIMFAHDQDDMEVTASHTVTVNDNINGSKTQEVSHKSTQQPASPNALSCQDEIGSSCTGDPSGEYLTSSKDQPSVPSSASAVSGEEGVVKVPSGTTGDSACSVSLPEETTGMRTPQNLVPPTDNSVPISSEQENLKSKNVSSQLPRDGPVDCSEESSDLVSCVSPPIQPLDSVAGSPDTRSAQRNQVPKGDSPQHEDLAMGLGLAGASLVPISKESKEGEGLSAEGETPLKDVQITSEQTEQLPVSDSPRDQTDPAPAPELSGILNVCSKLKNIRRKSAVLSVSEMAFADQLPKSSAQPEDTLRLGKTTVNEPNNLFYTKEQEDTHPEPGAAPIAADVGTALKDKYQGIKVPLGIFQPKLPNRRNPSVSSVQDVNTKSMGKGEALVSEVCVNTGGTPGSNKTGRQNFSPSRFIVEEFLPVCLEEMDSNESVSSELVENACSEVSKKQISHDEKNPFEETRTCNHTKRALEQDEEDLQSPKKVKQDEDMGDEAPQDLQVSAVPCHRGAGTTQHCWVHLGCQQSSWKVFSFL